MQEKKDNKDKVLNILDEDKDFIKISIKDGYQNGDVLDLNLKDVNYTWNFEHKELLIPTTSSSLSINKILDNLSLKSINKEDERFIEVEYVTKDGESVSLKEYVLNMYEDVIQEDDYVSSDVVNDIFTSHVKEELNLEKILSFDYKENQGADFLESSVEEKIPYEINLEEEGDVYKILKDSFSEGQDFLEIHGYDISHDKVSLEDFIEEFGEGFNYKVSKDQEDLNVNIYVENHQYNVVLKDVISDTDTALDDIIQNLIINSGEHKI